MRIKNWGDYQHFKNRTPPWIKLYRYILDDPDWHNLDDKSAKVLVMLWLVASEDRQGEGRLPCSEKLAFRLRMKEDQLIKCIQNLNHWLIHDDITMISGCHHSDTPEERRGEEKRDREETEGETEILSGEPDRIPYAQIIDYLNEQAGTSYKPTTKQTRQHISARWREGFRLEHFRRVVDAKCDDWLGDEKMQEYLRPQTLFGTKFESYLQKTKEAKRKWNVSSTP